jgi:hypothetical protein
MKSDMSYVNKVHEKYRREKGGKRKKDKEIK